MHQSEDFQVGSPLYVNVQRAISAAEGPSNVVWYSLRKQRVCGACYLKGKLATCLTHCP